jgi:hypothetical protein
MPALCGKGGGQSEERRFYTSGTHVWEDAMLCPPKPCRLGEPIAVSLERLVPADNFCRHREAKLALVFVRAWTRELHDERGRPFVGAVVRTASSSLVHVSRHRGIPV